MPSSPHNVSLDVAIMGREFRVTCPENDRDGLLKAVSYLDRKMREIRETGQVIGLERIAIMAALNITHDLLSSQHPEANDTEYRGRLARINSMLDLALAPQDNLF